MIYKKLTKEERFEFRRHKKYAAAIGKLLASDKHMTLSEARKILLGGQKNKTKPAKELL